LAEVPIPRKENPLTWWRENFIKVCPLLLSVYCARLQHQRPQRGFFQSRFNYHKTEKPLKAEICQYVNIFKQEH